MKYALDTSTRDELHIATIPDFSRGKVRTVKRLCETRQREVLPARLNLNVVGMNSAMRNRMACPRCAYRWSQVDSHTRERGF